jgi:hypothetical protein
LVSGAGDNLIGAEAGGDVALLSRAAVPIREAAAFFALAVAIRLIARTDFIEFALRVVRRCREDVLVTAAGGEGQRKEEEARPKREWRQGFHPGLQRL